MIKTKSSFKWRMYIGGCIIYGVFTVLVFLSIAIDIALGVIIFMLVVCSCVFALGFRMLVLGMRDAIICNRAKSLLKHEKQIFAAEVTAIVHNANAYFNMRFFKVVIQLSNDESVLLKTSRDYCDEYLPNLKVGDTVQVLTDGKYCLIDIESTGLMSETYEKVMLDRLTDDSEYVEYDFKWEEFCEIKKTVKKDIEIGNDIINN